MGRKRDDIWRDFYEALSWVFTRIHPAWSIPTAIVLFLVPALWFASTIKIPQLQPLGYLLGLVPATISILAGLAGWHNRRQRAAFLEQHVDMDWMNRLSWQDFERQVAEIYRQQGYYVQETGGGGADGGIDLRISRDGKTAIVQCKRWKTFKVGVKPVRELFGVMAAERADRAILITSGIYTDEALQFAEGKPLDLVDGAQLAAMLRQFQSSLKAALSSSVAEEAPAAKLPSEPDIPSRPKCPECGNDMVLRRARSGAHAGQKFWGCSMFSKTKCRGIRPVD